MAKLATMKKKLQLPEIPEEDQTPLVKVLLSLLEQYAQRVEEQDEEIARLKDEINVLKGEKKRPKFKPSKLDKKTDEEQEDKSSSDKRKKRPGSEKKPKTSQLTIHEEKVVKPDEPIPEGSRFKGYRDFVVQELRIEVQNTKYRQERWITPDGEVLTGELPKELNNRHFGPQLVSFILYQHHQCQTTQPLLLEQLHEWGVDISSGQINEILTTGHDALHREKEDLLKVGLVVSGYVTVDDSGARHKGKNGYVTHIGNDYFSWFSSTDSKSRINFLELLRAGETDYRLTEEAFNYMKQQKLAHKSLIALQDHADACFTNREQWNALLEKLSITTPRHQRIATEGALLGSILADGRCENLAIVSDDAGQFNVLLHGLCWVHAERLIHKMIPLNEAHREDLAKVRGDIWDFYKD